MAQQATTSDLYEGAGPNKRQYFIRLLDYARVALRMGNDGGQTANCQLENEIGRLCRQMGLRQLNQCISAPVNCKGSALLRWQMDADFSAGNHL